jgi:flavodoxin
MSIQSNYPLHLEIHLASATTDTTVTSMTTTMTHEPTIPVLILYASMRGTGLAAAEKIERLLPEKMLEQESPPLTVIPQLQTLDEFIQNPHWTPVVIIVASSYGSGDAPRGGRLFRKVCQQWIDECTKNQDKQTDIGEDGTSPINNEETSDPVSTGATASPEGDEATDNAVLDINDYDGETNSSSSLLLQGIQFALCGLGDSKYATYMKNPNTIYQALTAQGATLIPGTTQGMANAQPGREAQQNIITEWMEQLWQPLYHALCASSSVTEERLQAMNDATRQAAQHV